MGGDPGEVYAAAAVLDHHEDVEAAQEDGVSTWAKSTRRSSTGRSRLSALSSARSTQVSLGRGVSAQHGDFVTQDQDLDVLGCVGAGELRQPGQHAGEHQVRESKGHGGRSCWAACEP
jgi:hypothetical protein